MRSARFLLIPLLFHYSADEKSKIEESRTLFEEVGIYLEEFGPTSYAVKEFPAWFPDGEEQKIIEEVIEQVLTSREKSILVNFVKMLQL